ncbi:MAG: ribonuclease E inhibitor RraB [Pseudomonadota bacterium]
MIGVSGSTPSKDLIAENSAILAGFADRGVDLNQKLEFEFSVEFSSKDQAKEFRSIAREAMNRIKAEFGLKDFLFILCNYEDEGCFELKCCVETTPDVRLISTIEQTLGALAAERGGSDCFWEFPDPANNEVPTESGQEVGQ